METNHIANGSAATIEDVAPATRTARGTVTRDSETTALTRILKMLDDLDEPAQARVLGYIFDRYGVED